MAISATDRPSLDGAVLVRLPAADRSWPTRLPPVPGGRVLTVCLGHGDLLPSQPRGQTGGYRIVGVASGRAPVGPTVDVLVPLELRLAEPRWWSELAATASRIFDLRMGPVQEVLSSQLTLHLADARGAASTPGGR